MDANTSTRVLEERKEALLDLLPAVERLRWVREFEWAGSGRGEDGVHTLGYPQYDDDTIRVMDACGGGALTCFDYVGILERRGPPGWDVDTAAVAGDADAELTLALITAVVRSERFCDGAVADALRDGTLVRLFDRLRELYNM